jgi:hypothetical protein
MSRDWLAVYVGILQRPKYRRLSIEARAALFHVWCLAGGQSPEATWSTLDDLTEQVELDGWTTNATAVLAELIERRWLDVDVDGRVLVHDWDDHQLAATNAARRAYERDRKRDWRRAKPEPLSPAPLSPDTTGSSQGQHTTTQVSPNVRDTSGTDGDERPHKLRALEGLPPVDDSGALLDSASYDRGVMDRIAARLARLDANGGAA